MILVVDDDPSVTASLVLLLKRHGHSARTAATPREALAALERDDFELVLQDMNFSRSTSGEEGLELCRRIREMNPGLPVILITAWGSISLAVQGIKAGAADFVTKPWANDQLLGSVETALALSAVRPEESEPADRAALDARYDFGELVGRDPGLLKVLDVAGRVSATDASVLVTGPSGTGKELLAEGIHRNSRRRDRPFVKVNLGGISSTLFESEMFGHVRGAFTDARGDRRGRFEVAHGGTIFLDEIGEIDSSAQVKLLRVLQDRTYEVLGSSTTRKVDVRIVSATNRDLAEMVARGSFREDLLYRLNLISLRLPALADRAADVPLLTRHFLAGLARQYGQPELALAPEASGWLETRPWPGNVRQLKQTLERAVLVLGEGPLGRRDLEALSDLETRQRRQVALPRPGTMTLDEMEKAMISRSLGHYRGNLTRVAEALGLSRAALYRRLRKYDLESRSDPAAV